MKKVGELVVVARAHMSAGRHVGEFGLFRTSSYGGAMKPVYVQKIEACDSEGEAMLSALEAGIRRAKGMLGDPSLKAEPVPEAKRLQVAAFFAYNASAKTVPA